MITKNWWLYNWSFGLTVEYAIVCLYIFTVAHDVASLLETCDNILPVPQVQTRAVSGTGNMVSNPLNRKAIPAKWVRSNLSLGIPSHMSSTVGANVWKHKSKHSFVIFLTYMSLLPPAEQLWENKLINTRESNSKCLGSISGKLIAQNSKVFLLSKILYET